MLIINDHYRFVSVLGYKSKFFLNLGSPVNVKGHQSAQMLRLVTLLLTGNSYQTYVEMVASN